MVNSQNGWPVDKTGAHQDRNPIYGAVKVPNGVREGDVATVLRWVARRFHETVEPLTPGASWGWFVKPIEGSKAVSNHASGTAIDLNADQHPMGVAAAKNMTARQIAACHAIVRAAGGVVRWGGDYTGRPDPMHWEIVGDQAAVAALAKKITAPKTAPKEDLVALTDADITKLAAATAKATWAYPLEDPRTKAPKPAGAYQRYNDVVSDAAASKVIAAIAGVIAALPQLDTKALAVALAPAVAEQVIAALPADRDDITPAELQDAIVGALAELVARPAA